MTISPETLAEQMLGQEIVGKEDTRGLFLKEAIVLMFDGLIIFQGNLNMIEAIPRLQALSAGLGLPVAVIEKQTLKRYGKKKHKIGKHIGPGNWMLCSWDSEEGFDFGLKEKYNYYGIEKDKCIEKNDSLHTTNNNIVKSSAEEIVDRSHLGYNNHQHSAHRIASRNSNYFEDDDYWNDRGPWYN